MLHACGSKPNPEKEEAYQKAASIFAADESFYPILDEELYYFTTQTLDSITPLYINEQDAVKKLMKLETWLAFTTRDFTPKERQNLIDRKYLPRAIPIAYDGLAPSRTTVWPSSSTMPIPTRASPSTTLHAS